MNKSKKIMAIALLILTVVSLVPIFVISKYNIPQSDDYSAFLAKVTWNQTHSIKELVNVGFLNAYTFYKGWQGTYMSTFLWMFSPAIFGEQYYAITTYLMLIPFLLAYLYFTKKLIIDLLKQDWATWIIVYCMLIMTSIQLVPKAVSAFYWFNGSLLYTHGHLAAIFLFGLLISIILCKNKNKRTFQILLAILLVFIIGGQNYSSALATPLIIALLYFWLSIKKNKSAKSILPILVSSVAFSLICFIAPGNHLRGLELGGYNALETIYNSLLYGATFITRSNIGLIVAPVSVICFCLVIVLFMGEFVITNKHIFKYPLFFSLLCLCVFSSFFAPPMYAMAECGPPRIKNIIYYMFVLIFTANLTYVIGWAYNKIVQRFNESYEQNISKITLIYRKALVPVALCLIIVGTLFIGSNADRVTSISAYKSLKSGDAKQYLSEYQERLKILNSDEKDVVLSEFSVKPYLLFFSDIDENPSFWQNKSMSKYYNKNSIRKSKLQK